ncbi:MAG: SMI1/KNR4 family protein [Cytophaga sp.]|uniref:SMI1/KNR4 family protein n=1 Tax=Cytophaga sp. TaxID=29535 RepID=UPI003F815981
MKFLSFLNAYESQIGTSRGVSSSVIVEIEKEFHVKLPAAYKEYLSHYGAVCGSLLQSYYMTYPVLKENRSDAIEMINFDDRKSEADKPVLKDSYFFFGQWQGYIYYFFDCADEDENPVVYILNDGLQIEKYKNSFTEFLYDGVKQWV